MRVAALSTALLSILGTTAVLANEYELFFVGGGEMRGRMLGNQKYDGQCGAKPDGPSGWMFCNGGMAGLVHYFENLHMEKANVLSANVGNTFFGTLWWRRYKGKEMAKFFNGAVYEDDALKDSNAYTQMPVFDVHTVQQAEFYEGVTSLAPLLKELKAPKVLSNFDFSSEPLLADCNDTAVPPNPCLTDDYVIIEKGGRKNWRYWACTKQSQRDYYNGRECDSERKRRLRHRGADAYPQDADGSSRLQHRRYLEWIGTR